MKSEKGNEHSYFNLSAGDAAITGCLVSSAPVTMAQDSKNAWGEFTCDSASESKAIMRRRYPVRVLTSFTRKTGIPSKRQFEPSSS